MNTAVWPSRRLKFLASVTPSSVDKKAVNGERAVRLCNYTDVYKNGLIVDDMGFMEATASEEEVRRFLLLAGDVIVTKDSESWEDIAVAAYVPNDLPGVVCGYHLSLLRPNQHVADGKYLFYAFRTPVIAERLHVEAQGVTRFALNSDALASAVFPMPPRALQRGIAAFLDRKAAEIDALIAKKERLLELLEEKRAALITQAVTKGVTPGVAMRESGVGWLGAVPERWLVRRIVSVARLESGHTPDKKVPTYWEGGGIPWVSLNDTGYLRDHEYITDTAVETTAAGIANSSARILPAGAVVFSRDATIGRCAITTRPMAVSQHFIAYICSDAVAPEYLLFVLRSMTQELERLTMGATLTTIGMPDVKSLRIAVPSRKEQGAIVDYVRLAGAELEALRAKVRTALSLLREYRTALITAAVTGQIEVPVS